MSKSAKKWLIAGAFLVVIGLIIFVAVMSVYHWDFAKLGTTEYETNTYEISEKFSNILINTDTADILFAESNDGKCKVVCYEEEKEKHSIGVFEGTLTVISMYDGKWYENIGINVHSPKITVYLPKAEYSGFFVTESTGDVSIQNISAEKLDISVSTGEIKVSGVTCKGDIKTKVSTGEIKITDTKCKNFISTGTTGNVSLKNTIAEEKISVVRSTGDVKFNGSDAAEISVKTDTGNVTGSILSEKVFITETSTGNIKVPKTVTGGRCEIITSTGDIVIDIAKRK